jgi:hypothetical protein
MSYVNENDRNDSFSSSIAQLPFDIYHTILPTDFKTTPSFLQLDSQPWVQLLVNYLQWTILTLFLTRQRNSPTLAVPLTQILRFKPCDPAPLPQKSPA